MPRSRILTKFERKLEEVGLPLKVRLWDGTTLGTFPQSRVELTVNSPAALVSLAHPNMGGLARSYVEQQIDVEGSARDVLRATEVLCGGQTEVMRKRPRLRFHPWVRHTRFFDRKSI